MFAILLRFRPNFMRGGCLVPIGPIGPNLSHEIPKIGKKQMSPSFMGVGLRPDTGLRPSLFLSPDDGPFLVLVLIFAFVFFTYFPNFVGTDWDRWDRLGPGARPP